MHNTSKESKNTDNQARKSFLVLFMTEFWERFGFYAVTSLLVIFMSKQLGYSDTLAFSIFAAFSALMYITPALGGYIADNYLGYRRSLAAGAILLTAGYCTLALPFTGHLILALALVVVGQGFFKSMPYSMIDGIYKSKTQRKTLDSVYTLYYLSINLGAILPLLISGYLAQNHLWALAYATAAVGMALGALTFCCNYKRLKPADNKLGVKPVKAKIYLLLLATAAVALVVSWALLEWTEAAHIAVWSGSALVLAFIMFQCRHMTRAEQGRVIISILLMVSGAIFFALYYQQPTSLTLFIDRNVTRDLFGIHLPSSTFWIFNPFWIIVLGPILSWMYKRLSKRNNDLSIPVKFAIGSGSMAIGYLVIVLATYTHDANFHISAWWIVVSYLFQSAAELLVNALGPSMIAKLVPKEIKSIMMGMWFIATALGGVVAGSLASLTSIKKSLLGHNAYTMHVYAHAFLEFAILSTITSLLVLLLAKPYTKLMHTIK